MSAPPSADRQVFPRWRGYYETVRTGELSGGALDEPRSWTAFTQGRDRRAADYERFRETAFAADLVGSSVVLGVTAEARQAAEDILARSDVSPLLVRAARAVVEPEEDLEPPRSLAEVHEPTHGGLISFFRQSTRENQANAIRWSELSRAYAAAGYRDKADRAMKVAHGLAPDNRYILRCAARFAIYDHDPGRAHALLAASARTREDPWLLSAEIAAAAAANGRSRLIRTAQQMIAADRFSDFEFAELASALGTVEAHHGDDRAARRLFRRALRAPTDNAIAQAEWASQNIGGLEIPEALFNQPRTWEARALDAAGRGDWREAVDQARCWLDDQPFARRPAEFGSYQASAGADFESGAQLALDGLRANPREFLLANNAAFCLASLDRLDEAQREFDRIAVSKLNARQHATYLATKGLLAYRRGEPDTGRELYQQSMAAWRGQANAGNRTLALIMLAREELLARLPGALSVLQEAQDAGEKVPGGDLSLWVLQLKNASKALASGQDVTPPTLPRAVELPHPQTPEILPDQ